MRLLLPSCLFAFVSICVAIHPTAVAALGGSPKVSIHNDQLVVRLPGRSEVALSMRDGVVHGLAGVTVRGREVLGPLPEGGRAPIMSIIAGGTIEPVTDLAAYLKQRKEECTGFSDFPSRGQLDISEVPVQGVYTGWREEHGGVWIALQLEQGEAEWHFAPVEQAIGGGTYRGIRWKLRLTGAGRVFRVTVDEPVAFADGDWRFQQRGNQGKPGCEEEFQLSRSEDHAITERNYFARQQPYFFLAGRDGARVSYFDEVVCASVGEEKEADRVVLRSVIPVRGGYTTETSDKFWLWRDGDFSSKWDALNEWTYVWDSVVGRYQARMGIAPVEPVPTLFHQEFTLPGLEFGVTRDSRRTMDPPPLEESWLYQFAETILPKAHDWGVKVVELRAVLHSDADHEMHEYLEGSGNTGGVCDPWGLEISPALGGERGLAYVCDQAHERDMKVIIWSTPAHQSMSSPVLREHPEWLVWRADGQPEHRGYKGITAMSLRRGYLNYMVEGYRKLREQTGFDGVWGDSACSFGSDPDYIDYYPYPQLEWTAELQRRLQEMGCSVVLKEGCGPFGLSTRSSGLQGIRGREYLRYYYLFSHQGPGKLEPDAYFRALASKGVIEIRDPFEFDGLPEEAKQRNVRVNRAYMEALPLMKRRRVIGEGDTWLGVEWLDADGAARVLYSFEPMAWRVPKNANVRELMTGAAVVAEKGVVQPEPWRVYVFE